MPMRISLSRTPVSICDGHPQIRTGLDPGRSGIRWMSTLNPASFRNLMPGIGEWGRWIESSKISNQSSFWTPCARSQAMYGPRYRCRSEHLPESLGCLYTSNVVLGGALPVDFVKNLVFCVLHAQLHARTAAVS